MISKFKAKRRRKRLKARMKAVWTDLQEFRREGLITGKDYAACLCAAKKKICGSDDEYWRIMLGYSLDDVRSNNKTNSEASG